MIFLLYGVFCLSPAYAASMRCNGKIVSTGDSRFTVLTRCGEPSGRVDWEEEISEFISPFEKVSRFITVEEWVYNFGPTRFIRVLSFRDGVLTDIQTRDYGFPRDARPGFPCRDEADMGDTQVEILIKCGPPAYKEVREAETARRLDRFRRRRILIRVEEWYYNYGPAYFIDILVFENGRLVNMRTGEQGYY